MFSLKSNFDPERDIPNLSGRVYLITGGTSGLGLGTVESLAAHSPRHVYFMARNASKADELITRLQKKHAGLGITFIECDMASLESVQTAAKKFLSDASRLDVLMCNSGIMAQDPGTTKDGYEVQFQVNHLGHGLLIKLLLPLMLKTVQEPGADVRIVNLTSQAYRQAPKMGIDFATLKTDQAKLGGALYPQLVNRWRRYGQSKLANMLYARVLAEKYPQILSASVHPGYIFDTGISNGVPFLTMLPAFMLSVGNAVSVAEGPHTQLWAATAPREAVENGEYYEPFGVIGQRTTRQSNDAKLAQELWDWTQEALAEYD